MATSSHDPLLIRSAPYFPVDDVAKAVAYYETILGFRSEYAGGEPPQFAIVSRDRLPVMFRRVADATKISPNERQGGTWDAFFWVRDAERLFDELRSRDAEIAYGPVVQADYQMKEFAVRDLNGYVLGFGQDLSVLPSAAS
jgi:catechol 2,3-dioxygenase-like lactoylglutathione lyase family enzyme